MKYVYLFFLLHFASCGDPELIDLFPHDTPTQVATITQTTTPVPTATAIPILENPIVLAAENFKDGGGGNLWKPVSDTTGNLVVVFSSKFKKKFKECFIVKNDNKKEFLFCNDIYKCFGNPDKGGERLHMRSSIKCNQAKEVKVTCYDDNQEVTFTVADNLKSKVCTRHD